MNHEFMERNYVLETVHNTKLPSYALWDADSIHPYDITTNINWWERIVPLNKNKHQRVTTIINKWLHYYKNFEERATEYCSKRMGDVLSCDI